MPKSRNQIETDCIFCRQTLYETAVMAFGETVLGRPTDAIATNCNKNPDGQSHRTSLATGLEIYEQIQ